ncbi:nitroreductase family protein [Thermodesulfobacteriota bacterium]
MEYDTFLEFVKSRRTIRKIKPDPLPDDTVDKLIEAARWAPSGFNMQPWEFVVVKEPDLQSAIKKAVDDYRTNDFFAMEATREEWQGSPWKPSPGGEFLLPLAPVYIALFGDTRSNQGLPMPARYTNQKLYSIFESTLSNAFIYMVLAAHSLGLAAFYVSATKYPKVGGLIKDILNIPDYLVLYDMLVVGKPDMEVPPKLMRDKDEMIHYGKAGPDEFRSEEKLREQIIKFRAGNVGRHKDADTA